MDILSLLLMGVSLSMDALAVSISTGICVPDLTKRHAFKIAAYFGGFQALMPALGYLLGSAVSGYIRAFDHWVAFFLLAFLGVRMIVQAMRGGKQGGEESAGMLSHKKLLTLALATSIDALAVGVSLAFLSVSIVLAAAVIGLTTFCISFAGAVFGKRLGEKFKTRAEIIGGAVLIAIGARILIEHLFFAG
ncbi:MAG TPA: manganese efflux pump MntP [Clostridiales bacterium]|nr:manganese efflux pump MntP [Clostridiales bacterium]